MFFFWGVHLELSFKLRTLTPRSRSGVLSFLESMTSREAVNLHPQLVVEPAIWGMLHRSERIRWRNTNSQVWWMINKGPW